MKYDRFPYIATLTRIQLDRLIGRNNVRTIIDVGAYIGETCRNLASLYKGAEVHAIEPSSENCKVLMDESRKRSNIKVHQLAICSHNKEAILYVRSDRKNSGSNTLYSETVDDEKGTFDHETVRCLTFDAFCIQNNIRDIDLLMLNCEGGEFEIFDHALSREMIARVSVLDLSMHGKEFAYITKEFMEKKVEINKFLLGAGFTTVYGQPFTEIESLPFRHIRQVWIK